MTPATIHLGFEVGTGEAVAIPLKHLAVTGQTQESGKTTTLEALAARAGVPALAFVTKRGEKSFAGGRHVRPYFRDRADWQFVTALLDATLQEKNKFLRPWVMKICRTTRTLADVQAKVREALETAKGINEGVYTQLDAYLDLIVPEIGRASLADGLVLGKGLNVMDVSGFTTPMQMLFVQSALDWVNEHEKDTVVIVPEAWEFIPEGKGSPAKASAVSLVRKGAGLGNRIWVDSQDMAGVDKTILRGCAVWLVGVQREANEIKRNLSNIPAGIRRPKPAEIAGLDRGQFYACWADRTVKVYVQPAWMTHHAAREISLGRGSPFSRPHQPITPTREDPVSTQADDRDAKLDKLLDLLTRQVAGGSPTAPAIAAPAADEEGMYQRFKARLQEEAPALLQVLVQRPEIEVKVERRTIEADGDGLQGKLALLIAGGFFDSGATGYAAWKELTRLGSNPAKVSVYTGLKDLAKLGFLTKEGEEGYRAVPDMKRNIKKG